MSQGNALYVEGGVKRPDGQFIRHILMTESEIPEFRKKWKNTGIYITAYWYDSKDQKEANLLGDLYMDFDSTEFEEVRADAIRTIAMFKAIFDIPQDLLKLYFSGKKGVHLLVPREIFRIEPRKDLNEIYRVIAKDIHQVLKYKTMDLKIYDRVRLFRVANSIHPDTGLHKIPLTYEELRNLSTEQIAKMAQDSREIEHKEPHPILKAIDQYRRYVEQWQYEQNHRLSKRQKPVTLDFLPFCIRELLHQEIPSGQRNNTCAAIAQYFFARGNTEEKAFQKLMAWNKKHCSPPLPEKEILQTVKSIYRGHYNYGCSTYFSLSGVCDPACKFYTRRR